LIDWAIQSLNTLVRVEHAGNFKSNASPEFPEGRMLFLQRFARFMRLDGGNRPLGKREGEEKEREAASVRKNELEHFNQPPPRYILDGFTIRSIRTNIWSIRTSGVSG
jgi:hypothetical protein